MLGRTVEGDGEKVRLTVIVPKEYAILAAWLAFKADREGEGKSGPLPRPISLYLDDGRPSRDWTRARDYFTAAIGASLKAP